MTGPSQQVHAPIRDLLAPKLGEIAIGSWVKHVATPGPKKVLSIEGTHALLQHLSGFRAGWHPLKDLQPIKPQASEESSG